MSDTSTPPASDPDDDPDDDAGSDPRAEETPPPGPAGLIGVVVETLAIMAAALVREHLGRLLAPTPMADKSVADKSNDDKSADDKSEDDKSEDDKSVDKEGVPGEGAADNLDADNTAKSPSRSGHGLVLAVVFAVVAATLFWRHRKK